MRDEPTVLNSNALIRALTQTFIAQQLPKQEWTHTAHFAAALCLHREYDDVDLSRDLPRIIRAHNDAVGTPNSDSEGYHETLTQFYAQLIVHVCERMPLAAMHEQLAAIMHSPLGARDFPLRFWSKAVLFSAEARRHWVAPDIAQLDFAAIPLGAA